MNSSNSICSLVVIISVTFVHFLISFAHSISLSLEISSHVNVSKSLITHNQLLQYWLINISFLFFFFTSFQVPWAISIIIRVIFSLLHHLSKFSNWNVFIFIYFFVCLKGEKECSLMGTTKIAEASSSLENI